MPRNFFPRILPASFYGRAVLILIIPIIVIQIVLSVVFIQRHYERVTAQMTTNILRDIHFLTARLNQTPEPEATLAEFADLIDILQIEIMLPEQASPIPAPPFVPRFDLAGREIIRVLEKELPSLVAADLITRSGDLRMWVRSNHGVLELRLPRRLVTTSNPHQLLVIVFLASALMTLIAFQFLRLQIRPIRRLGAAAEAYGRGERVALRASGAREIRAAAHAFIDMRNRIERQRAQQKIMLSGVSHDMRTPLTRMRLILSMMPEDDDRAALEAEIADLDKRLTGFLDFTRGQMTENMTKTDPGALVEDLVARYQSAGYALTLRRAVDLPASLMADPDALSRALDNLISNALRHGQQADIHMDVAQGHLRISVDDDGPGIAPEDRERACEPFVRLDEARNADSGGLGLGLAIVSEVARAHGGKLELARSPTRGGLRAILQLPLPQRR